MSAPAESSSLLKQAVPKRSYAAARAAYEAGDIEASIQVGPHEEEHAESGEHLKAVVFGGLDGILTSFAIVSGAAGGGLGPAVTLVMGLSNIFADALSMGVGEFLSSRAEHDFAVAERAREAWEMQNDREGEIEEMVDIYEERGMKRDDAYKVIQIMAQYEDFFVDVMCVEELGLQVPSDDDTANAFKEGVIMFASFALFGAMPLVVYAVAPFTDADLSDDALFAIACGATAVTLFTLGAIKGSFGVSSWWASGLEMTVLGLVCAAISYEVGGAVGDAVSG